jgi:prevent-host-death family protein
MEHVSVRELRQHLSRYLRRVEKGEHLLVTERRRPVAMLGPLPENADILDLMIATGEATAPIGDLLELADPRPAPPGAPSSEEIFEDMRADRF